jgi:hypothetical protein
VWKPDDAIQAHAGRKVGFMTLGDCIVIVLMIVQIILGCLGYL